MQMSWMMDNGEYHCGTPDNKWWQTMGNDRWSGMADNYKRWIMTFNDGWQTNGNDEQGMRNNVEWQTKWKVIYW